MLWGLSSYWLRSRTAQPTWVWMQAFCILKWVRVSERERERTCIRCTVRLSQTRHSVRKLRVLRAGSAPIQSDPQSVPVWQLLSEKPSEQKRNTGSCHWQHSASLLTEQQRNRTVLTGVTDTPYDMMRLLSLVRFDTAAPEMSMRPFLQNCADKITACTRVSILYPHTHDQLEEPNSSWNNSVDPATVLVKKIRDWAGDKQSLANS